MEIPDFSTVPFQKSHPVAPVIRRIAEFMEAKGMSICRISSIELTGQADPDAVLLFLQDQVMIFPIRQQEKKRFLPFQTSKQHHR